MITGVFTYLVFKSPKSLMKCSPLSYVPIAVLGVKVRPVRPNISVVTGYMKHISASF